MSNIMSRKDDLDFMKLYKRAGYTQKSFAEALSRRFEEIGSNRKVTTKSIREWNTRKFEPRLTPSETLEMCILLNCNLYDLALVTKSRPSESQKTQELSEPLENKRLEHNPNNQSCSPKGDNLCCSSNGDNFSPIPMDQLEKLTISSVVNVTQQLAQITQQLAQLTANDQSHSKN